MFICTATAALAAALLAGPVTPADPEPSAAAAATPASAGQGAPAAANQTSAAPKAAAAPTAAAPTTAAQTTAAQTTAAKPAAAAQTDPGAQVGPGGGGARPPAYQLPDPTPTMFHKITKGKGGIQHEVLVVPIPTDPSMGGPRPIGLPDLGYQAFQQRSKPVYKARDAHKGRERDSGPRHRRPVRAR